MIHFTHYTSVYQPIFTCNCSLFTHTISVSDILSQSTYRTWWNHIDPFWPTFSCFSYSVLFPLHWPSSAPVQPFDWPPCWPNKTWNIWYCTHIPLHWVFWTQIGFTLCLLVLFALIWIIQGTIPVKPILSVGNGFSCTILITFWRMTVNSSESADS